LDAHLRPSAAGYAGCNAGGQGVIVMSNIFYIIGVVVVVLFVLGYLGLR
jgi:hypothetical protein